MVWALRFDGVNEAAETGVHVISNPTTDNFYVEIDIEALSGDGTYVAQNTSNTESNRGFQLGSSSGLGGFFVVIGGSRTDLSITPSAGLWRFEFDGGTYSVLKDSSPQGSGVLSRGTNSEPSSTLCFGARHAGSNSSYSFFKSMDLKSCEIGVISGSAIGNWDATLSDQTSNPPILDDLVSNNNATGVNMDVINWIDLGGGVVEFTFSINTASSAPIESAFIISSDFQASTASTVSFASAKIQQSDFDINSQSLPSFDSAKVQSSAFEIDSSSTFSVLTGDTNIVEFTFSINSQSILSADSAKVQSSAFDIESQSNAGIESAKVQASGFDVDSGANVDWSASAIQGRTFAIDSESVFTVVVEGGEPVFIIGLTLELSSDIITLELSSEQEIRELA